MSLAEHDEHDEYAAFGPWVDEVRDGSTLPRLYRAHPIDFARTELVLKIPRDIARRDADPAMDLYDALIIVDSEHLTVLERREHGLGEHGNAERGYSERGYSERTVPHRSLLGLSNSVDLLDGRLTLLLTDGDPLEIRYNGSSRETIERLSRTLRRLALVSTGTGIDTSRGRPALPFAPTRQGLDRDELEYALVGDWNELVADEPGLTLVAAHRARVVPPLGGPLSRVAHRLRPTVLQAAIIGATHDELHLVHRRDPLHRSTKPDISDAHTVVVLREGVEFTTRPHPRYGGVDVVLVESGRATLEILVPGAEGAAADQATAPRPAS